MRIDQVACQLYTLRDHCKTAADLAVTCKKVKAIGYAAVQISGVGPIPEEEIVRITKGEGLVICATHENGGTIVNETQKVIDRLGKLGTPYTAYPYPHMPVATEDDVKRLCELLDAAGAKMRAAGQVLTYHNHALEFRKIGGRPYLESIYLGTDPNNLQSELDMYWVQAGGGEPTTWAKRMFGRMPLLHLKDYGIHPDGKGGLISEIGKGSIDWNSVCAAGDQGGCQWFIVEQDTCPGDPFESVAISFAYLRDQVATRA